MVLAWVCGQPRLRSYELSRGEESQNMALPYGRRGRVNPLLALPLLQAPPLPQTPTCAGTTGYGHCCQPLSPHPSCAKKWVIEHISASDHLLPPLHLS